MTVVVCLVSDDAIHREAIGRFAEDQRIRLADVASTDDHVLETIQREHADVALLDMPLVEACEFARQLRRTTPDVKLVAMSVAPADVGTCAEAGICACLPPTARSERVIEVVQSAARDRFPCSPDVAAALMRRIESLARGQRPAQLERVLTPMEHKVAELIAQDLRIKQIAARLHVAESTVKTHVHNILRKLGLKRRADVAAMVRGGVGAAEMSEADEERRGQCRST